MFEAILVVEGSSDVQTATKLAERVLLEKIDWLEPELLENLFRWSGLDAETPYSCWKDIKYISQRAKDSGLPLPKFRGHGKSGPLKSDGATTMKILNLIRLIQLQGDRQIRVVILIRDLDNQPARKTGIEKARNEHMGRQPELQIIVGVADRMREAWVLNGFVSSSSQETTTLEKIKNQLNFNPCEESHKLRSTLLSEPDRIRNPKVVLNELTNGDKLREQQCWEETCLDLLRERGICTGLTAYLQEIEQLLVPILTDPSLT